MLVYTEGERDGDAQSGGEAAARSPSVQVEIWPNAEAGTTVEGFVFYATLPIPESCRLELSSVANHLLLILYSVIC